MEAWQYVKRTRTAWFVIFGVSLFAGICFAPQPLPEPDVSQWSAQSEQHLKEQLTRWQDRLKLSDWDISLELARSADLRPGTLGNVHWDKPAKTAHIRVLDPNDYQMNYYAAVRDMEFTIVHELVHLELASLPRSEASRGDEEVAVNQMAEALLALERGE